MNKAFELSGAAYQRGTAQARWFPQQREAVQTAVEQRLYQAASTLALAHIKTYLHQQWRFAERECRDHLGELHGIAHGFDLAPEHLFAYLHLGVVTDLAPADGCSTWALVHPEQGILVGKNRDFRGEHLSLQQVFLHTDPNWPQRVLCVGSLGSPGAYSSGINNAGLALVDTQIASADHGVGWLRYFLMTQMLAYCADVNTALAFIQNATHAGGGSLLLADPSGAMAAVEMGHRRVKVESTDQSWIARTNHFSADGPAERKIPAQDPMRASSLGRLQTLQSALAGCSGDLAALQALMGTHDTPALAGLCRHGQDGDAQTISASLFTCRAKKLYFCPGNPCRNGWVCYGF